MKEEKKQRYAAAQQTGFSWSGQGELDRDWQNYLNREVFTYDPEKDPVYQQYRRQYTQAGKLAMEDTVGMAASLTGGYGNSYAQNAGQQAYQSYLQQLNNVLPALYSDAYARYQAEGEALYNDILLQEKNRQQAYEEQQDSFGRLTELMALGYTPTDDELAGAGMTRQQADAVAGAYTAKTASTASTGTGSGSGTTTKKNPAGYSTQEIVSLQKTAGIPVTGVWDEKTQEVWKIGYTKYGYSESKRVKEFRLRIHTLAQHDAVERHMWGAYTHYVLYELIQDGTLSTEEKNYLSHIYKITDADYSWLTSHGKI